MQIQCRFREESDVTNGVIIPDFSSPQNIHSEEELTFMRWKLTEKNDSSLIYQSAYSALYWESTVLSTLLEISNTKMRVFALMQPDKCVIYIHQISWEEG